MIKLSSSTLVGQIIGLIATPILSRIYFPADFGIFQLFVSVVTLVAPVACYAYYYAIVIPEDHEDAANIVMLCLTLITVTAAIVGMLFFIFSGAIEHALNAPGLEGYLPLLPLAIIISGFAYVLGYWFSRMEQYTIIAKANVYSSVAGKSFSIGYGFFHSTAFGLILGSVINDATILVMLLKKAGENISLFSRTSYRRMKELMIFYKKFPQYSLGSDLAANVVIQIVPFILALFFSPVVVGYYALAYMGLRLPSKLVGNAIGTVFFQQACVEKNRTGEIKHVVKSVHRRLISFGIFICLILVIAGPVIFSFVLGSRWATAGQYAQILAPSFFMTFVSIPLLFIYPVLERQAVGFWFNMSLLISSAAALIIGGLMQSPIISMLLLSVTGTLFLGGVNMYSLKIAGVSAFDAFKEIAKHLAISLIVSMPVIIAVFLSFSSLKIIGLIVLSSLVYYLIIIYRDEKIRDGMMKILENVIRDK